jgi:hypothetical protein
MVAAGSLLAGWIGPVGADENFPPRPNTLVLDEGDLLSPEAEEKLFTQMAEFEATYGIQLYLYTLRFVPRIDEKDRAALMLEAWQLDEGPTILALFEQLTNSMNYAFTDAAENQVGMRTLRTILSDSVIYSSLAVTDDLAYEERIESAMNQVMYQLAAQLPQRDPSTRWRTHDSWILLMFVGGVGVAIVAVGGLWYLNRRSPPRAIHPFDADDEGEGDPEVAIDIESPPQQAIFTLPSNEESILPRRVRRRRRVRPVGGTRSELPQPRNPDP